MSDKPEEHKDIHSLNELKAKVIGVLENGLTPDDIYFEFDGYNTYQIMCKKFGLCGLITKERFEELEKAAGDDPN
jgi:hypothetical protein